MRCRSKEDAEAQNAKFMSFAEGIAREIKERGTEISDDMFEFGRSKEWR